MTQDCERIISYITEMCRAYNAECKVGDKMLKDISYYKLNGAIELAFILGYDIYVRHRHDLAALPINWFSIARAGKLIETINI